MRSWVLALVFGGAACVGRGAEESLLAEPLPADPARRLHAHNDYLQPVPLASLRHGVGSVEADVYLVDGRLLVAHERWQLQPHKSLQALYLEPLAAAAARGELPAGEPPFVLLVDVKADADAAYLRLVEELAPLRPWLTHFRDGRIERGAITVLVSGARPSRRLLDVPERVVALDGRPGDLDQNPPPPVHLVPWISTSFRSIAEWTGSDDLLPDERERIEDLVERTHAQGRELRFWSAPDRPEGWRAFVELGVDRISTDRPAAAARWMRAPSW